jgi:hypothetical protein
MLEALWSAEFRSNFGMQGTGIVVLETGRVFGGDSSMIYVGSFKADDKVIRFDINVKKYAHVPGMASVVGLDSFNLKVSGTPAREGFLLSGHVVEDPSRTMTIKVTRRAELP